jgi:serine/threonine protein kinase
MSSEAHPSLGALEALAARRLPADDAESVQRHVEQCPQCQATLGSLADVTETYTAPPKRERIGRYELLEKLGEGGMGAVYKARHLDLDKIVAVKLLTARLSSDAAAIERFRREMKAVGKLEHPNIVRAMDAGEENGTHYIAVEYIDGLDLATWIRRHGPAPIRQACEIVRQAAVGLDALHRAGLVHRDIKPSNLMLTPDGTVKILDLGLVRLHADTAPGAELTGTGQAMGTADYIAPEQVTDSHHVDIRADIYSLGCTFYKLLTGQAPFSVEKYATVGSKMVAHVNQPIPAIRRLRPDVPEEVAAILQRMVAKKPADRFLVPADLVAGLDDVLTRAQIDSIRGHTLSTRRKLTLAVGGAAALAIVGIIAAANRDAVLSFVGKGRIDGDSRTNGAKPEPDEPDKSHAEPGTNGGGVKVKRKTEEELFNERLDAVALNADGSPYPLLDAGGEFIGIGFKGMDFKVTNANSAWGASEDGRTTAGVALVSAGELKQWKDIVDSQLKNIGSVSHGSSSGMWKMYFDACEKYGLGLMWVRSPNGGIAFQLSECTVGYYVPSKSNGDRKYLFPFVEGVHQNRIVPGFHNTEIRQSFSGISPIIPIKDDLYPVRLRSLSNDMNRVLNGHISLIYVPLGDADLAQKGAKPHDDRAKSGTRRERRR